MRTPEERQARCYLCGKLQTSDHDGAKCWFANACGAHFVLHGIVAPGKTVVQRCTLRYDHTGPHGLRGDEARVVTKPCGTTRNGVPCGMPRGHLGRHAWGEPHWRAAPDAFRAWNAIGGEIARRPEDRASCRNHADPLLHPDGISSRPDGRRVVGPATRDDLPRRRGTFEVVGTYGEDKP